MKQEYAEKIISDLDERYIEESIRYVKKSKKPYIRGLKWAGRIAACLGIVFVLSVSLLSVAAAAGVLPAYNMLYHLYPEIAEHLSPVNVSCTDNGVEMKVEAVYIHGDSADIYISMKDLTGDRIDETIDLFDSYNIYVPGDQIGTCALVEYDAENRAAIFLVSVQVMGEEITGRRMTFSASRFLSGKQETTVDLPEIDLQNIPEITEAQPESALNIRGGGMNTGSDAMRIEDVKRYLFPDDGLHILSGGKAAVTAYGFIDGKLHIQAYYEDIFTYDNHGDIYLVDENGNEIHCLVNTAFWDEENKGSYEEYIFAVGPEDDLSRYSVQGYFVTCSNLYEGNWRVDFPIENR